MIGLTKFSKYSDDDIATAQRVGAQAISSLLGQDTMPGMKLYHNVIAEQLDAPTKYLKSVLGKIATARQVGVSHFDLHYYPNSRGSGYGWAWNNGEQFCSWWLPVYYGIKEEFPDLHIGYPKLEMGTGIGDYRCSSRQFMADSWPAIEAADFLSALTTWDDNGDDGVSRSIWYMYYLSEKINKDLTVTFYNSNNNVAKRRKAEQYITFYEEMRNLDNVIAAFCHTLSSPEDSEVWATWRSDSGESPIPSLVARYIRGLDS
jgi:hypothetical protein